HAKQEALPPLGIALIGGLAAFAFLETPIAHMLGVHLPESGHGAPGEHTAPVSSSTAVWALRIGVFVAGAVAGWLAAGIVNLALGTFFKGFNWSFDRTIAGYGRVVGLFVRLSIVMLAIYAGLIGLTYLGFRAVPAGFIPEQDKGYLVVNA